jgi:hypothetical protein
MEGENSNIERITFEQIQEFKDLNLSEIEAVENEYMIVLLSYDTVTKKFGTALMNTSSGSGGVSSNTQSVLLSNVEVKTDDLSISRGYVFKKGIDMTSVVKLLSEPPVKSVLSLNASRVLFQVNTSHALTLSYTYTINGGGLLDETTVSYLEGSTSILAASDVFFSSPKEIEFKVSGNMGGNDLFFAEKLYGTINAKAIYPVFSGKGASTLTDAILVDISTDREMVLDYATPVAYLTTYWFALHTSINPKSWVELDSSGNELASNGGTIDSLFEVSLPITYKNNSYLIYSTTHETSFTGDVKIKL